MSLSDLAIAGLTSSEGCFREDMEAELVGHNLGPSCKKQARTSAAWMLSCIGLFALQRQKASSWTAGSFPPRKPILVQGSSTLGIWETEALNANVPGPSTFVPQGQNHVIGQMASAAKSSQMQLLATNPPSFIAQVTNHIEALRIADCGVTQSRSSFLCKSEIRPISPARRARGAEGAEGIRNRNNQLLAFATGRVWLAQSKQ
ncbi:hypothetical protein V8C37DRAFT_264395 [Trichoderma ceciliae]